MFFSIDSLQRLLLRSVWVTVVSMFALLTLTNDRLNMVQLSQADRLNESLLATQHYNRILKFAKCHTPFPKVVNINSELHPSAIKKYIPHCTILHYCGPHSGCCRQENEHCVPKTIEEVKLYFWTIELTPRGHKKGIEVITMKNHTECMCAPINGGTHGGTTSWNVSPSTVSSTTVASSSSSSDQNPDHNFETTISTTVAQLEQQQQQVQHVPTDPKESSSA